MLFQNMNQGKLIGDLGKKFDEVKQSLDQVKDSVDNISIDQPPPTPPINYEFQIVNEKKLNKAEDEKDILILQGWVIQQFVVQGNGKRFYFVMKRIVP